VSNNPRRPDLGRVIARRILSEEGVVGRQVVVSIGLPRPDPLEGGDWECPFLIEGVARSEVQKAFGVDSMQALILAIQGIRATLEQTGRSFFWVDPEIGVDFPLNVPTTWGKQFVERVRLAIERETVRVWRARIKSSWAKVRAEEAELKAQGAKPSKIAKALAEKKTFLRNREAEVENLKPGWSIPLPHGRRTKR
jgi:hypothetical protein